MGRRNWMAAAISLGLAGTVVPAMAGPAPVEIFRTALEQAAATLPDSPGIVVSVQAPRRGIDWQASTGKADPGGTPLTPDHPFRVASVTKAFVAAAILRLEEEGKLSLSQPIKALIAPETAVLLRSGGYDPDRITVRHLMDHTSGLRDFFDDPAYEKTMLAQPKRRWARLEQIAIAMKVGPAYGAPGERFHYADTGYSLLGEVLERATGLAMGPALRSLLPYDGLGLYNTWLESLEPAPTGVKPRAHQYASGIDMTGADPSYDLYGGGGLVSTLGDLVRFFRGIFRGHVFRDPATLAAGLTLATAEAGEGYMLMARPALFAPEKVGPHACLGLGGYYGTLVVHCPAIDLTIGFNANTANPDSFDVAAKFMEAVGSVLGTEPSTAPSR
ncbi:serine hydrolase [Niveispirillum sp.]|uniref:serine hydrolase domain-containing protein n=1 Tax=Niveispirillum sp. TaxID=1917217 RepID=UPI001B77E9D7|nr:serine hydrolase domain-containing protein [Niveispirillum sp.]MBP7339521.1 beta-lactamase family protein [Niveispirillum sp.]